MANKHRDIDKDELMRYAIEYCDECIEAVKTVTASYKLVQIPERHIPTVDYFLHHWLRRERPEFHSKMIKESQWYNAREDSNHPLSETIKEVTKVFHSLSRDIVANEGKGIFYGKNALGMSDRRDDTTEGKIQIEIVEHKRDDNKEE